MDNPVMDLTRTDGRRTPSGFGAAAARSRGRTGRLARPTLRGALFLALGGAIFIIAWAFDVRDLIFVSGVLLLVPLVSLIYVIVHPLRVEVSRAFRPGTVSAGLGAVVTIQIHNRTQAPLLGLRWRDTAAGGVSVPATAALRALAPTRPGHRSAADTAVVSYEVRPLGRGVYPVGPLMLGRVDPFGLAYSEWPVGAPHDLTVTPRVTAVPGNAVSITTGEGSRHERLRHLNNDSDELIAREYRPGDPMRRVNWPATARHGEIMVRQEEQRSHPEARVVLDTTAGGALGDRGARSAKIADSSAEFERAIELAASIAVHLLEGGFRVDVVELGPCQLVARRPRAGDSAVPLDPDEGRHGGLRGDDPVSFTGPEGSRGLLDALAQVVQQDRVPRAGAADDDRLGAAALGQQIPTFAVLVDTGEGDTGDLVALRSLSRPAVAFVFDTMAEQAVHRIEEAGWHCVRLTRRSGIAEAWEQASEERGERRGPN